MKHLWSIRQVITLPNTSVRLALNEPQVILIHIHVAVLVLFVLSIQDEFF